VKDDGALQIGGLPTPLMRLLLSRRSHRRYGAEPVTPEQVGAILEAAGLFCRQVGFLAPRLHIVAGQERARVVSAAMRGVVGLVNPWLPFSKASHVMLCGAAIAPGGVPRDLAIKQASMTMQVAILAATELGLATCWMAGIAHERVERTVPLPDGAELIAISPLGAPASARAWSWDSLVHNTVSKRRKPLAELCMAERWRSS
jgi:nitroreductase